MATTSWQLENDREDRIAARLAKRQGWATLPATPAPKGEPAPKLVRVTCANGRTHEELTIFAARQWAEWGHCCLAKHTFENIA